MFGAICEFLAVTKWMSAATSAKHAGNYHKINSIQFNLTVMISYNRQYCLFIAELILLLLRIIALHTGHCCYDDVHTSFIVVFSDKGHSIVVKTAV